MDPARIFWGGASRHFASFSRCFASFCIVSRRFASFRVVFALFCVNLLCVESNSNTLHCIATTFVVFFCYLDEIYIDLFNICDFFISAHQFCPPPAPPQISIWGGAPTPPYKYIPVYIHISQSSLRGQSNQKCFQHPEDTIFVVIKLKVYIYQQPP